MFFADFDHNSPSRHLHAVPVKILILSVYSHSECEASVGNLRSLQLKARKIRLKRVAHCFWVLI